MSDEATDDAKAFSTIWAFSPPQTSTDKRAIELLQLVTTDEAAFCARDAAELHHNMFDVAVFASKPRREATQDLRRLFLYTQTTYYHVHNSFDYQRDEIFPAAEWMTWKGLIREMHVHPMLLTVIWHSHQNRYISRAFAQFLQRELCSDEIPSDVADVETFKRDREFVRLFYPEMTRREWPNELPDY
ncbi:MAG: hypothetical protein LC802_09780 [Acidobacteria bacterium]|nr:hypothetical protein [Acidobacteriota bacterium]